MVMVAAKYKRGFVMISLLVHIVINKRKREDVTNANSYVLITCVLVTQDSNLNVSSSLYFITWKPLWKVTV